jgi:uncharacterized protein
MRFPDAVIQVFCKAPVPGTVKTRLMPELTSHQAADVHRRLTLQTLDLVCRDKLCAVQLCCSPDINHSFFAQIAHAYPVSLTTQTEGDLGDRMNQALTEALGQYQQAILIGTDCPSFTLADFQQALQALATHYDAVLAPTEDGGYSMIGVKQPAPELFHAINWSSSEVLQQTRSNISSLQLNCFELDMQWDVDNYADFLKFIKYTN